MDVVKLNTFNNANTNSNTDRLIVFIPYLILWLY